jgi:hypothetical protein
MDVSRRIGILVFFGVPAIIGGGVIYGLTHSYAPVIVYEVFLLLLAGALVSR